MKFISRLYSFATLLLMIVCATPVCAQTETKKLVSLLENSANLENFKTQVAQRWTVWNKQPAKPNPALKADIRLLFNLAPQDPLWRDRFIAIMKAEYSRSFTTRDAEQYFYKRLNLSPEDSVLQQTLGQLLYKKHSPHTTSEVKQAYSVLNQAFDQWDAKKNQQALALFQSAHLKHSQEFTAILAYHLRDHNQIEAAKKLLSPLHTKSDYLNLIPEMYAEILAAETALKNPKVTVEQKIQAHIILGQLSQASKMLAQVPNSSARALLQARIYEKQGGFYHEATPYYLQYYHDLWHAQLPKFTPVVYKAQLEDVNSIDLIALKFRTSAELIKKVNERRHDWIETYRMLIVPVIQHEFQWPAKGYVSSHFGYRLHPLTGTWRLHSGLDIETHKGDQALAADSGQVIRSDFDKECGNTLVIQHNPNVKMVYCHAEKLLIPKGQSVKKGQPVTITGTTGSSASIHLHFGIKYQDKFRDPMDWL